MEWKKLVARKQIYSNYHPRHFWAEEAHLRLHWPQFISCVSERDSERGCYKIKLTPAFLCCAQVAAPIGPTQLEELTQFYLFFLIELSYGPLAGLFSSKDGIEWKTKIFLVYRARFYKQVRWPGTWMTHEDFWIGIEKTIFKDFPTNLHTK